ncbi:MarR family winged helix-turn-helix transcriptional regulator [Blastococcus sp. LR1]|uniref:MarR family winged helix-turn-helix transcriptional regulator n=1 Tax=Blastococcus sp. LR1 TaxID=2877000 RepID=UPI001CCF0CE2|nr:MarR family transcriptional regulator [Blastococcus sp. LR1]MCA0145388.1 MarR family transcriptional regulator [Blastococcus sp. LR1]
MTAQDGATTPRWLDEQEMAAWLPLLRVVQLLPQALDRRLRSEAGIGHAYDQVLATLSAQPERALAMGELARLTATSPSRLSHAVAALEERGWVSRRPCPTDRRIQYACLTDGGFALLAGIAPGHVAEVRRVVFDGLDAEDVARLRVLMTTLSGVLAEPPVPSAQVAREGHVRGA